MNVLLVGLIVSLADEGLLIDKPHQDVGKAIIFCAEHGVNSKTLQAVFGFAGFSQMGRFDWRENPAPYEFRQWNQYGVWVEWDGPVRIPKTGFGRRMRLHGGIGP